MNKMPVPQKSSTSSKEYSFKFLLLGDAEVGKSSLVKRFVSNIFIDGCQGPHSYELYKKQLLIQQKTVNLEIWDQSYLQLFSGASNKPQIPNKLDAVILVFDFNYARSFEHLDNLLGRFEELIDKNIPVILVGNKNDLQPALTEKRAKAFCDTYNKKSDNKFKFLGFYSASAKTGTGVNEIFQELATKVLEKHRQETQETQEVDLKGIQLKNALIERLNDYIKKVDDGKGGAEGKNYGYGFLHHKQSRSFNRQLNYKLANALRDELRTLSNPSIEDILNLFEEQNLEDKRTEFANKISGRPCFINRGIRSPDLNYIIEMGQGKDPSKIRCYFKSMTLS